MLRRKLYLLLIWVVFAAVSLSSCARVNSPASSGSTSVVALSVKTLPLEKKMTPAEIYKKYADAVVSIRSEKPVEEGVEGARTIVSHGSGFIATANGYVVTNHHVIEGAEKIAVSLRNGEVFEARLCGSTKDNDIALLKIDGDNLPYVSVGRSSTLMVGEQIAAIGNPLGELAYSMTVGYVSALDRKINAGGARINMLQTDAPINSGNSGGPVFDMGGKVIGVVSAKYSGRSNSGAYIEGLGFAIPIDDVLPILRDFD